MDRNERRVLVFIRMALLLATVLMAAVALVLRERLATTPANVAALQYAFVAQAGFAVIIMFVLRRMMARPENADRRVPLTIVAWAVAESAAVLGAVVVMLGADLWYLVAGLFIFYMSSRTHPMLE